jgi:D-alanyl-D-alanine carboxypeptidase
MNVSAHVPAGLSKGRRFSPLSLAIPAQVLWLSAGLLLAFAVPFVFADLVEVPRDAYYAIYVGAVFAFVGLWAHATQPGLRGLIARRWRWGIALGLLAAVVLVFGVLRESSTPHPHGWTFVGAIVWRGIVYGAADGLLLSVFPILAVFALFEARRSKGRHRSRKAIAGVGAAALGASLVFAAVYHLGYPDFRGGKVSKPIAADAIWSAPTLFTLSPLGAPVAHIGLHVSAVVHSYEGDLFLPPHREAATLRRPKLQAVLGRLADDASVAPGAVGFVLTPQGTWSGTAGLADIRARTPMNADDSFRIMSLTKTYVATVVLQLVEEGKLQLSDTVGDVLPGALPADKDGLTVRQLLTHTSGLYDSMSDGLGALTDAKTRPSFLASIRDPAVRREVEAIVARVERDPFTVFPAKVWVDIAGSQPLYFKPGTSTHYSNPGYVLLGWMIERVTKAPLATALANRIFAPLGLSHSWYVPGPTMPQPYAHGYLVPGGFANPTSRTFDGTRLTLGLAGASSVVATAEDTARFYAGVLSGKLLKPSTLHAWMLSENMGVGVYPTRCGVAYGHSGAFFAYTSAALVSADGKRAAVVLVNGRGSNADASVGAAVAELFCGA